MVEAVTPETIDRAFAGLRAKSPKLGASSLSVQMPTPALSQLQLSAGDPEHGENETWLADATGAPVMRQVTPLADFIAAMHTRLHLPAAIGSLVVGLAGMALLALILSGVLAHPRLFKDAFVLRRGGSLRLEEADLHNRLGVWGLPFHLTVTLTGAVLGLFFLIFGTLAASAYQGDMKRATTDVFGNLPEADSRPAALPAARNLVEAVHLKTPAAQIRWISIRQPGTHGQTIVVAAREPGQLDLYEYYFFDPAGKFLRSSGAEHGSAGQQTMAALQPLHFGWFGGLPVKLAYGILGLALMVVTSTGITTWLARRRDKGRPAPVWEQIWTATAWGQPAAFAAAALSTISWPGAGAATGWALGTAIAYTVAIIPIGRRDFSRSLRIGTAALLGLASLTHGLIWLGRTATGSVLDATLIAAAVIILLRLPLRSATRTAKEQASS